MKKRDNDERRITIRLPKELAEDIDRFREERGMSFTEFLRRSCREKLENEKNIESMKLQSMIHLDENEIRRIALDAIKEAVQTEPNLFGLEVLGDLKTKYEKNKRKKNRVNPGR